MRMASFVVATVAPDDDDDDDNMDADDDFGIDDCTWIRPCSERGSVESDRRPP